MENIHGINARKAIYSIHDRNMQITYHIWFGFLQMTKVKDEDLDSCGKQKIPNS